MSEEKPQSPLSESIPPPPPSRRPLSEQPVALGMSPLPPPAVARRTSFLPSPPPVRPPLPTAPPVARVGKQHPSEIDLKRLEEENLGLRERLAAAREEVKVEHKNVERFRSELAHMKAKAAALRPASAISRSEIERLRADHLQEIRDLKRRQQNELDDRNRSHRAELSQLKREHHIELAQHDKKVAKHENHHIAASGQNLEELRRELEELRQKTAAFRQKNTELREANGELERRLREAELQAAAALPADAPTFDDLTELKGVGPKVAQALRAAGITRFDQIAAWTDADIEEVAPKIKTAAGRIRKSDWVAQAKRKVS